MVRALEVMGHLETWTWPPERGRLFQGLTRQADPAASLSWVGLESGRYVLFCYLRLLLWVLGLLRPIGMGPQPHQHKPSNQKD